MKLLKTLVFFIILVALAGYVYFYEIKGGEERDKIKKLEEKVFNFEKDSVRAIEIRSALKQFYFEKVEDGWKIFRPVETDGEKTTIDGLVNAMRDLKKVREFDIKKDDLKDYGLVGRSTLVILIFNDGSRDSVRFGDDTPVGSNVFANKSDTLVYMVASYTKNHATKNLFDYRDKSITKVKRTDIREFRVKNENGKFYLLKEGNDWFLKEPKETKADNSTVSSFLSKMEHGKAKSVVSELLENPQNYRLQKPNFEIDLYLGESLAHKRIIFSSLHDNISYVKDASRPHVFTVDSVFIGDINKNLFQFRDKSFAEYNKDKADSVVVAQGDSLLTFTKDTSDTWLLASQKKVKTWKMNSLLNSIKNLKAKKFLMENISTTTALGLANPERIIRVFSNGDKIQELRLAVAGDDQKVAFCTHSQVVAEIEQSTYNNFEVKISEFLEEEKQTSEDTS
jgi:hypothetical protein